MDRPLCSVVIPAYNVERYVAAAVESALAQTYAPVEVIVVNDGSTDGTAAALDPYLDRIVYVDQENRGVAAARNSALARARGEYVALLDADDLWRPERLERCIAVLERDARDERDIFVTTDAFLLEVDVETSKRYYGAMIGGTFPEPGNQLGELARGNFVFTSIVTRRELLEKVGPFDERFAQSEDYDMWLRLVLSGARAVLIREPLAFYRVRPDSTTSDRTGLWSNHLAVLEARLPEIWRHGARGRGRDVYDIAGALSERGARRDAARFYLMAARHRDLPASARAKALVNSVRHSLASLAPASDRLDGPG